MANHAKRLAKTSGQPIENYGLWSRRWMPREERKAKLRKQPNMLICMNGIWNLDAPCHTFVSQGCDTKSG